MSESDINLQLEALKKANPNLTTHELHHLLESQLQGTQDSNTAHTHHVSEHQRLSRSEEIRVDNPNKAPLFHVVIGAYTNETEARLMLKNVKLAGFQSASIEFKK